jgi:hypothetical protein
VDDAACVGERECVGDVAEHALDLLERAPARPAPQEGRDALTLDEGHDEVDDAVALVDGEDRDDARVVELCRGLCLAEKSLTHLGIEGELRREHLHGNAAVQAAVEGAVDDRHAAAPKLGLDEVPIADRARDAIAQMVGHPGPSDDRAPAPCLAPVAAAAGRTRPSSSAT